MTTATLTLTDFLLARIAEDEAMAQAASQQQRVTWATTADTAASAAGPNAGLFILFTNPARVLAECEAKRRIVELHKVTFERVEVRGFEEPDTHELEHSCEVCGWFPPGQACDTVKALAAVYADHPDYREEWRP